MTTDERSFGYLLRRYRLAALFTQEQLAERAHLSYRTISDLERGAKHTPRRDTVLLLADALELPSGERAALIAAAHPAEQRPETPNPSREFPDRQNYPPGQLTSFVGREQQISAVSDLLRRSDMHLVSLVGPGGTGKTRLALQIMASMGDAFPGGRFFVALDAVTDPSLFMPTIASTLGVREEGSQSLLDRLTVFLQGKRLLLVLDNLEQLLPAAVEIAALLGGCPMLTALVTSREPLSIRGEQVFPVPPMSLPPIDHRSTFQALSQYEAVQLFIARASSALMGFAVDNENAPAVAEICARLDGLPLAIELAAARMRMFRTPQTLLARLTSRLDLLTEGPADAPRRHRTLRATIDWSYHLLTPSEQRLFRRLAVFVGGFDLDTPQAVCGRDSSPEGTLVGSIGSLLDRNLLRVLDEHEPRYAMLETIREYAAEKLAESGEDASVKMAHADYFMEVALQADLARSGPEQGTWYARMEREQDNLRAALGVFLEQWPEQGLRLAAAMRGFWATRGRYSEGRDWLERLLAVGAAASPEVRSKALFSLGWLAYWQGDYERAQPVIEECVTIYRQLGDQAGIGTSVNCLGILAFSQGIFQEAEKHYKESLAIYRQLDNPVGIAEQLNNLGLLAYRRGDNGRAIRLCEESLVLEQGLGNQAGIATSLGNLGWFVYCQGDHRRAQQLYDESLMIFRQLGHQTGIAEQLHQSGILAADQREYERAWKLHEESLEINRQVGNAEGIAGSLRQLGALAMDQGKYVEAQQLYEESLVIHRQLGNQEGVAALLECLSFLAAKQDGPTQSGAQHAHES